ncbi:MAG: pyridoxamine 5'-phosphate oxidase family protein [Cyanobacteria bacterium P01_E01_bin.34]
MNGRSTGATQWKSLLLAALHRNRSDRSVRFLQLATVDCHNRPRNRTVVFRGFAEGRATIMLAVDSRSEKLEQLEHNSHAAICWYFSKTREQFRLTGQVTVVTESGVVNPSAIYYPDNAELTNCESTNAELTNQEQGHWQQATRLQLWEELSDSAKLLWYWPQPKGERAPTNAFLSQPPTDSLYPPDTFVLLLFNATEVDRLELRGEPQNRTIYSQRTEGWQTRTVNP